jgi:hypothetical protein
MDEHLPLYSWIRQDASISLARIARISSKPGSPGQESFTIQLDTVETLSGKHEQSRLYEFDLPVSEIARLKFPEPVWGRITLREGVQVLLVVGAAPARPPSPLYIDGVPAQAALSRLLAVIQEEGKRAASKARLETYVNWLAQGDIIGKLFGGEALAKDKLPGVDQSGHVATAFVKAYDVERDIYVRLSLGTWMWEDIFPHTNTKGQAEIINAAIRSATDTAEAIRGLSLNHLVEIDPQQLARPEIVPTAAVLKALEERQAQESSAEARLQVHKAMDALKR